MPDIPADLLAKLQAAEDKLSTATAKDAEHETDIIAYQAAVAKEASSGAAALSLHQEANGAAQDFIAAFRAHFGLPSP